MLLLAPRRDGSVVALILACLLVAMEFAGAYGPLSAVLPVSGFTTLLVVALFVAVLTVRHWWWRLPLPAVAAMAMYVVAQGVSAVASSVSPAVTAQAVTDSAKQLVFLAVLVVLLTAAPEPVRWPALAASIAVPLAAVCSLAAADQWLLGNGFHFFGFETVTTARGVGVVTARHAGPLPDANFWGRFLALGLPFAMALQARTYAGAAAVLGERRRRSAAHRGTWVTRAGRLGASLAIALVAVGVYLTGSRGAFIATGLGVLVFLAARSVPVRRILWGAPLAGLALTIPGVGSRLLSSFSLSESAQRAGADGSVVERLATQQVALRMVEQDPLTGVGPGGYAETFAREAATTDLAIGRVVAPHNLYLGLWAETGLLGLLAWLVLVGTTLALGVRLVTLTARAGDQSVRHLRPYAAAALAGVVAWSTASAFLHLSHLRVLLVVIAATAVLDREVVDRTSRTEPPGSAGALDRDSSLGAVRRWAGLGAAVALVAALAGAVTLTDRPQATLSGWLVPDDDGTYALSLRTRTAVVPTFAVVLGSAVGGRVGAQGEPASGLVTLTATASTGPAAVTLLQEAAARAPGVLARSRLDRFYRLRWSEPRTAAPLGRLLSVAGAGGAGAVLGGLVGALLAVRRLRWKDPT